MRKTLTYNIPDYIYSLENTLKKKATQEYDGPDYIILWVDIESGRIEQTFGPENEPDRPLPLNVRREILPANNTENAIKIGILYGGLATPKVYEVSVGPVDQPNAIVSDPTDLRTVYDESKIVEDYTAPLQFKPHTRDRSDEFIRSERNARLANSDSRVAPDMPEALRQQWLDYRQKLRDLPTDWADCPNWLIRFPLSPDETIDANFDDPEVRVIRIFQRSEEDKRKLLQLPPGAN